MRYNNILYRAGLAGKVDAGSILLHMDIQMYVMINPKTIDVTRLYLMTRRTLSGRVLSE